MQIVKFKNGIDIYPWPDHPNPIAQRCRVLAMKKNSNDIACISAPELREIGKDEFGDYMRALRAAAAELGWSDILSK